MAQRIPPRFDSTSALLALTLLAAVVQPATSAAAQPFALEAVRPRVEDRAATEPRAHDERDPDPAVLYLGAGARVGISELGGETSAGVGYFPSSRVAIGVLVRAGVQGFGELFGDSVSVVFVEPGLGLLGRAPPFTLIFDAGLGAGPATYDTSCFDLLGDGCTAPPAPPSRIVGTRRQCVRRRRLARADDRARDGRSDPRRRARLRVLSAQLGPTFRLA
jgi:hypothetical protein